MNNFNYYINLLKNIDENSHIFININLPIVGEAYNKSLMLNKRVVDINGDHISFDIDKMSYPHITLKMGSIKVENLNLLFEILNNYFCDKKQMIFKTYPIILKEPNYIYYFSNIIDENLFNISSDLDKILGEYMSEPEYKLSNENPHHITIGKRHKKDKKIADVIGENLGEVKCDRVCVSIKGEFGTCLGTIKTIYLN